MEGYDVFLEALKWIALVFMAGFVGYFGKYLGIKVSSRFHKDEGAKAQEPDKIQTVALSGQNGDKPPASGKEDEKLRKKQDKERLKQAKKLNKAKSRQH
jgi:hypothetical protein